MSTFCNSLQTKIVRQVEFNIFVWSFKSLIQNLTVKCWVNFSWIMAHENTRGFSHDKVENKLFKASVFEWTKDEFTGTWRSLGMTAPQNSAAVTDVTFRSTHWKGYQSKLLFFHSKGGRCSFWGFRLLRWPEIAMISEPRWTSAWSYSLRHRYDKYEF